MHLRAVQGKGDKVMAQKKRQIRLTESQRHLRDSIKAYDKAVGHLIDADGAAYWWSAEARTRSHIAIDLACSVLSLLQKQLNAEFGLRETA